MTDYRIEAKVRNARILRALESINETPTGFAKKRGLNISRMCQLAALRISATNAKGDWWPEVIALCEATRKMPCDLFTARQLHAAEITNISRDVDEDVLRLESGRVAQELLPSPEPSYDQRKIATDLLNWMRERNPQHARAIALSQSGLTLEEIGADLGLSRERVRQIICQAERQMKNRAKRIWRVESYGDLVE